MIARFPAPLFKKKSLLKTFLNPTFILFFFWRFKFSICVMHYFILILYSHKLLHTPRHCAVVHRPHLTVSYAKRGDVFSKGGKERKKQREKKRKEMQRAGPQRAQDSRWTHSCLFSPLLPPLSRSSTTSFAPSRPPEPNYHTTWPQNRPIGAVPSPRPWWITTVHMQHVSGAARNYCGRCSNFSSFASLFHNCHRIPDIRTLRTFTHAVPNCLVLQ